MPPCTTSRARPTLATSREERHYARSPLLGGIELLAARYRHHVFPRHAQDSVVLGLVEQGVIEFMSGGRTISIGEGALLFIPPGIVHEAVGCMELPWTYRALYLGAAQWQSLCDAAAVPTPSVATVVRHVPTYERLRRAHARLVGQELGERTLEETLRSVASALANGGQEVDRRGQGIGSDATLERVRRLLDEETARRVSLGEMAAMAGLSRFHFLRSFSRAYGVSPYAYSLNRRLLQVRRRLADGAPISMTALDFGFADQAHLTRHFLRTIGVTPGEYQRAFAEAR